MGGGKDHAKVIYQKVIQPRRQHPEKQLQQQDDEWEFLASLIAFLQDEWQLPERLPMVYNIQPVSQEYTPHDDHDNQNHPNENENDKRDTIDMNDYLDAPLPSVSSTESNQHPKHNSQQEENTDPAVLILESPLSPLPVATTMQVEVVVVTPPPSVSSSAESGRTRMMVGLLIVVKKSIHAADAFSQLPPMVQNLFAASEQEIVKHLDRSLQDFVVAPTTATRLANQPTTSRRRPSTCTCSSSSSSSGSLVEDPSSPKSVDLPFSTELDMSSSSSSSPDWVGELWGEEDLQELSQLEEQTKKQQHEPSAHQTNQHHDHHHPTTPTTPTSVIDAEIVKESPPTPETPTRDMQPPQKTRDPVAGAAHDYAVRAAQTIAQQRQTEGFAVTAARQIAQQRRRQQSSPTKKKKTGSVAGRVSKPIPKDDGPSKQTTTATTTMPMAGSSSTRTVLPDPVDLTTLQPASLRPENRGPRAFFQTISRPRDYHQKDYKTNDTKAAKTTASARSMTTKATNNTTAELRPTTMEKKDSRSKKESNKAARNSHSKPKKQRADPTTDTKTRVAAKEEEDNDTVMRTAKEALDEMADGAPDLTPEQLLESVMQFGDAKEKEERIGDGFVSGAFEKAKEFLQQQHQQKQEPVGQTNVQVKDYEQDIPNMRVPSPEDELKQMFEAGERLADNRITTSLNNPQSLQSEGGTTENDVNRLIANEKDVSDYARVLEEDLVELQVKLNKSPLGDEPDMAEGSRPSLDIFSGPEVYNPNVDPETAVNWPGALPGTKDWKKQLERMPKAMQEAVTQAEFAASALSRLNETVTLSNVTEYTIGKQKVTEEQVRNMRKVMHDAVSIGLIRDPLQLLKERSRLQLLVDELWNQPEDRVREIAMNYKDVLLSDNFVQLMRERISNMVERDLESLRTESQGGPDDSSVEADDSVERDNVRERELLGQLVVQAQLLVKEARALGAELEAQQLEIIRSICKVAMDPMHKTEEETAMALTDVVRDMRPLFDDAFVAYLKFAVAEEEGRLARAGVLDDPQHNQWWCVLKIVQNGVYTELARGIQRYMDHIGYVLRMETPTERRMLLEKLIDVMPTLDVRPFVSVVDNLAGALGDGARGEFGGDTPAGQEETFVLAGLTNQILQLYRDVHELLPPERIALKAKDADDWAARQKKILLDRRKATQQRLQAARDTQDFDQAVDALGKQGEMERFDF